MRRILVHSVAFYLALSLAHFLSSAPVSAAQNGRSNQPPGSGTDAAGQQMPPGNSPPSQPGPPTQQSKDVNIPPPTSTPSSEPSRPSAPNAVGATQPDHKDAALAASSKPAAPGSVSSDLDSRNKLATLKVCLRMEDDSPFSGSGSIRVMPSEGYEVNGSATEAEGEMLFSELAPGTYSVEVSAAGFLTVRQKIEIDEGNRLRTLFVVMKTKPLPARVSETSLPSPTPTSFGEREPSKTSWIPPSIDDLLPEVQPDVECSLPHVIRGAGARMAQLVNNLQKFSATEHVDHFMVDAAGARHGPETRTFDYVVIISPGHGGSFALDEYRNGRVDPNQFPARVATEGLSAMALVFHPLLISEFNFSCEGLGSWNGHPAWQVHFAQRPDRPNRIRAYVIGGQNYAVPIKGRAWVDAGTYQVLRLESELMKPIRDIGLTQEHLSIDYGPVNFRTHNQQLWLPLGAEVYAERRGRRYYRRHTFSDFKIFTVDTDQNIHAPKESYCFTNTTDHDIAGILTVSPVSGISLKAVSIQFLVPPGRSVYKVVGPGKDISMPVEQVGSATFMHNGPAGSIKADAYLVKESTLDVIADTPISMSP